SGSDGPEPAPVAVIAAPAKAGAQPIEVSAQPVASARPDPIVQRPVVVEEMATETVDDTVRPITAAAFAAVPTNAEAVQPAEELPRMPDDPGVDPGEERENSSRRFRLF